MFLSPLHTNSNLAYFGSSLLSETVLGVYIEWWMNYDGAIIRDNDGTTKELLFNIAGSPLCGMNTCTAIGRNGLYHSITIRSFAPVWQSFAKVNARYYHCKCKYLVYGTEKVIDVLSKENLLNL
jgi:hypothetical protein